MLMSLESETTLMLQGVKKKIHPLKVGSALGID